MRFQSLFWMLPPLLCLAHGCGNPGAPQTDHASAARVIIGFDETVNPPDLKLLASLGRELGCELEPLQAIGGNAYVYNCVTAHTEESLSRKLDGLGRHQGVRYAELDRKRKIQN